jgi:hypothetical protein
MNIATRTLVRHGVTKWAAAARHTPIADMAFTSAGEAQAKALTSFPTEMQFDAICSSPMLHARTAILTGFANGTLEADSLEWQYGRHEGIVPKNSGRRSELECLPQCSTRGGNARPSGELLRSPAATLAATGPPT